MGSLLVVSGPPGSGKSTVSQLLVQQQAPSVLIEGDRFFAFLARGAIEPWRPEADAQNVVVTRAAAAAAGRFAGGGFFTVYDGVVGPWYLDAFATSTGLSELAYVVLMPDVETCVDRVSSRTGHGFRDERATRKMHAEFAAATIDPRHVLPTGSAPVTDVLDRIAAARDAGHLRYQPRLPRP